ncbi:MAG: hypothetical protein ACYSTN_07150, partial [Planctomycetota bacterium]
VRLIETWNTEFDMVRCEVCDKPYMPVKEFEYIQTKLGKQIPLEKVCPRCLKSKTVSRLRTAVTINE